MNKRLESLIKQSPEDELSSVNWNKAGVHIFAHNSKNEMSALIGDFYVREEELVVGGKGGSVAKFKFSEISELKVSYNHINFIYARNNKVTIEKVS